MNLPEADQPTEKKRHATYGVGLRMNPRLHAQAEGEPQRPEHRWRCKQPPILLLAHTLPVSGGDL